MTTAAVVLPRTRRSKETRRHLLIYLGLTPFLILAVFPIFWMLITALKQEPDLYRMDVVPFWFSLPPTLKNFALLFFRTSYSDWIVNTLSDISIVYLLTNGGPNGATEILPTLAYRVGIQAGALGRGAAISLFLFPLLLPAMILLLRNLRRREW